MSKIITDEYILEILKQHNYLSGAEYEWLADRLEALAAENAKLREALEKYADEKNWEYCETPNFGEMVLFTATWDGPTIAREALREG